MTNFDATLNRANWMALMAQSVDTDLQLLRRFASDGAQDAFATLVCRLVREIEVTVPPTERGSWFSGLVFAPDGRTLATSCVGIGIDAFDIGTGKRLWSDPSGSGRESLAFFPDGRSLVVGEWAAQLHFRDAANGRKSESLPAKHNIVDDVAVSPDGRLLATSHHDGVVCLRDPATGSVLKEWQAHERDDVAWSLSFGPGGIWLASSGDRTVAVWDVASGTLLHRFEGHSSRAYSARFALDGRTLLSHSMDLTGYVWDLRPKLGPADARTTAQLWDDLGGEPRAAFRAVWLAAADPKAPVVFGEKLPSPAQVDGKRFQKLVEELASPEFKTREAAEKEIKTFGLGALQLARKAREETDSPEVRDRLDRLIRGWTVEAMTPEGWRRRRAVVAMELAGTMESQELLKRWAKDVPGTVLSNAAAAALGRLEQLNNQKPIPSR